MKSLFTFIVEFWQREGLLFSAQWITDLFKNDKIYFRILPCLVYGHYTSWHDSWGMEILSLFPTNPFSLAP